jgi:hypothetical protein
MIIFQKHAFLWHLLGQIVGSLLSANARQLLCSPRDRRESKLHGHHHTGSTGLETLFTIVALLGQSFVQAATKTKYTKNLLLFISLVPFNSALQHFLACNCPIIYEKR